MIFCEQCRDKNNWLYLSFTIGLFLFKKIIPWITLLLHIRLAHGRCRPIANHLFSLLNSALNLIFNDLWIMIVNFFFHFLEVIYIYIYVIVYPNKEDSDQNF